MENNQTFSYRYSAAQNKEVERIREKYLPKEESKMDLLRRLDRRVQTAGMIQALSLGVVGCLVFGVGMCFGLGVLMGASFLPYLFGALGTLLMIPAYPVYRAVERKTREALTPEILRLTDEILN